ncbi:MAG: hypothetical protein WCJ29_03045 [bacterium]
MKRISVLQTLVISLFGVLTFADHAQALVGPPAVGPIVVGIGLVNVFIAIFFFVCFPVALVGVVMRLLGYKKEGNGIGWKWNLKEAFLRFLKYLLYHAALFGGWLLTLSFIDWQTFTGSMGPGRYDNSLLAGSLALIAGQYFLFAFYTLLWAAVGPYMVYYWRNLRKIPTFKPSLGAHVRLALWNVIIFVAVGGLVYLLGRL